MILKISPFVKFELLVVFVNIFSADNIYLVRDCENLQFPI